MKRAMASCLSLVLLLALIDIESRRLHLVKQVLTQAWTDQFLEGLGQLSHNAARRHLTHADSARSVRRGVIASASAGEEKDSCRIPDQIGHDLHASNSNHSHLSKSLKAPHSLQSTPVCTTKIQDSASQRLNSAPPIALCNRSPFRSCVPASSETTSGRRLRSCWISCQRFELFYPTLIPQATPTVHQSHRRNLLLSYHSPFVHRPRSGQR